jgi:hypothetical protein
MKKLKKAELKVTKGGVVPVGCSTSWDPKRRCCRIWDEEYADRPVCPEI